MLAGIREQKYIYIKDFFSKEELSILQPYCLDKTLFCTPENLQDPQSLTSAWFYKDHIMNIMLSNKLKKAEEISKVQLLPTYAFWRGYTFGSILSEHTDRASCEISITANIDTCGTKWNLLFEDNPVDIEVGDAVMYLGVELNHSREGSFKGDYMAQVFLHYVDKNGVFADHRYDRIHNNLI